MVGDISIIVCDIYRRLPMGEKWSRTGGVQPGLFSSIAQLDPSCKWVNSLRHSYLVEPSSSRSLSTPSCELSRFYHEMRVIHRRGPKITGVWLDSSHGPSLQMSKSSSMIWVNRSEKTLSGGCNERDHCVGKCIHSSVNIDQCCVEPRRHEVSEIQEFFYSCIDRGSTLL